MFRISIREIFLVLLVLAIGLGWYVDRFTLSEKLVLAKRWRKCAGALEMALRDQGWDVTWSFEESMVWLTRDPAAQGSNHGLSLTRFEPTQDMR